MMVEKRVDEATPLYLYRFGLNNVPIAGDVFEVVESLDAARERQRLVLSHAK